MNIASVIRRALFDANVVRQNGTSSALLTLAELLSWAGDAQRLLEAEWRRSGKDYNLVTRESDDGSFTFEGETYNNSGYQLLSTTRTYTLPPDLISLKRIRAITAAYREYIFTPMDVNNPIFRGLENSDNPGGSEIYWDVVGRRTLRLSHPMPATSEVELMYNARLPKLRIYTDATPGTCGVTLDSASVTSMLALLSEGLTIPAELILNTSGANGSPVVVSQTSTDDFVQPAGLRGGSARHYPIESFDSATALTLEATYPFATDTSVGYLIASAPLYLEDHYHIVCLYLKAMIRDKVGDLKGHESAMRNFGKAIGNFQYDIAKRADEAEFAEDFVG